MKKQLTAVILCIVILFTSFNLFVSSAKATTHLITPADSYTYTGATDFSGSGDGIGYIVSWSWVCDAILNGLTFSFYHNNQQLSSNSSIPADSAVVSYSPVDALYNLPVDDPFGGISSILASVDNLRFEFSIYCNGDEICYVETDADVNIYESYSWTIDLSETINATHIPTGYNFETDSYSFVNDKSPDISQKYFDGIFEAGTASLAHNAYHQSGGLCYGMAFTTASIYNGFPDITRWAYRTGLTSSELATTIRELKRDTFWGKQSAVYIGGDFDECITLYDFIKYAFIYQYSVEAVQKLNHSSNNASDLLAVVKACTDSNQMGVAVGFSLYNGHSGPGGHEVLAVGYEGNDILIDNPNNMTSLERLTVHNDGSWEFGGYNNNDHWLDWDVATHRPYSILFSGNRVVANVNTSSTNSRNEHYVLGTEKLNPDYNLVSINSSDFQIDTDYIEIPKSKDGNQNDTNNTMIWVREGELTIDGLTNTTNTIACAGDDTVITTTCTAGTEVSINVQEQEAKIKTGVGETAEVSFEIVQEGDIDDTNVCVKAVGTANCDEVLVVKTSDGLQVEGIAEGTVTLLINDDPVAEKDFNITKKTVNIKYDATGEETELEISGTNNPTQPENPTVPDKPSDEQTSEKCKYCDTVHPNTFIGKLTQFFHSILYFFAHLFGKM